MCELGDEAAPRETGDPRSSGRGGAFRPSRARALTLAALLVLVVLTLLRVGRDVPSKNELLYLVRLEETYAGGPLASDFTLSDADEHFVFNHLAALVTLVLPLEAAGWVGRIGSWTAILLLLLTLGRRLGAGTIGSAIAIAFWVGAGQSLVGHSWMLGTFEAKSFAYPLLLGALLSVVAGRFGLSGLLAGLSASFHPSVGLFGAVGCGVAACVPAPGGRRVTLRELITFGALAAVGALPAALALLPSLASGSEVTATDWMLAARIDQSYHLDPFTFPRARIAALLAQLVAIVALAWHSREVAWRRIAAFVAATAAVFVAGVGFRAAGAYALLASFPFRLFPLVTPLVFLLGLAYVARALVSGERVGPSWGTSRRAALAVFGAVGLVMLPDPVTPYLGTIFARSWPTDAPPAGVAEAFRWVDANLPVDARGLVPPDADRYALHAMRRPLVVTTEFPVYGHLGEWHARVRAVGGDLPPGLSTTERRERMGMYFAEIPEQEMRAILDRYAADFLITTADYALPVAFARDEVRVYLAPAASDTTESGLDAS